MLKIGETTLKKVILKRFPNDFAILLEHYSSSGFIHKSAEFIYVIFFVPVNLSFDVKLLCFTIFFVLINHCFEKYTNYKFNSRASVFVIFSFIIYNLYIDIFFVCASAFRYVESVFFTLSSWNIRIKEIHYCWFPAIIFQNGQTFLLNRNLLCFLPKIILSPAQLVATWMIRCLNMRNRQHKSNEQRHWLAEFSVKY